jgi:hypothetical protein
VTPSSIREDRHVTNYLREIQLPLLDANGKPVTQEVMDAVAEDYRIAAAGEPLSDEFMARVKARGDLVDCGRTLRAIVMCARDPKRGIDLEEMREIDKLVAVIDATPLGGTLVLSEPDYIAFCSRARAFRVAEYNKGLHVCLEMLFAAPVIKESPKSPRHPMDRHFEQRDYRTVQSG